MKAEVKNGMKASFLIIGIAIAVLFLFSQMQDTRAWYVSGTYGYRYPIVGTGGNFTVEVIDRNHAVMNWTCWTNCTSGCYLYDTDSDLNNSVADLVVADGSDVRQALDCEESGADYLAAEMWQGADVYTGFHLTGDGELGISGRGYAITNAGATFISGELGQAASTATNSWVQTNFTPENYDYNFSYTLWINTPSGAGDNDFAFGAFNNPGSTIDIRHDVTTTPDTFEYRIDAYICEGTLEVDDSTWHMYTVIWDATTYNLTVYQDTTQDCKVQEDGVRQSPNFLYPLFIGDRTDGDGGSAEPIDSDFDEFRWFNYTLSETDITNLYNENLAIGAQEEAPAGPTGFIFPYFVSPTATNGTEAQGQSYINWTIMDADGGVGFFNCKFDINGTNVTGTWYNVSETSKCWYTETGFTENETRCAIGWAEYINGWNVTDDMVCRTTNVADTNPPDIAFVAPTGVNGTEGVNVTFIYWSASANENLDTCYFDINGTNVSVSASGSPNCHYNETGLTGNVTRCAYAYANDTAGNWNMTLDYICRSTNEQQSVPGNYRYPITGSGDNFTVEIIDRNHAVMNWTCWTNCTSGCFIYDTSSDLNDSISELTIQDGSGVRQALDCEESGADYLAAEMWQGAQLGAGWHFEDLSPGSLTSGGSDAQNNGGAAATGKFGQSIYCDGGSDYINQSYVIDSGDNFTVSMWLKIPDDATDDDFIFGAWDQAGSSHALDFRYDGSAATEQIDYRVGSTAYGLQEVSDDTWKFVVMRFDNSTLNITGWMNGAIDIIGATDAEIYVTIPAYFCDQNHNNAPRGVAMKMTVDEARFWNYTLTDSEIISLYNENLAIGAQEEVSDTTPPTITVVNPDNATIESDGSVININVTTNEAANTCLYSFNDGANYTMLGSGTNWYQINQTVVANNTLNNVSVYCNDTSGNMGLNNTVWFTYLNETGAPAPGPESPSVSLNQPANGASLTSLTVQFNYTPQNAWGGAELYINDTSSLNVSSNWTVSGADGGGFLNIKDGFVWQCDQDSGHARKIWANNGSIACQLSSGLGACYAAPVVEADYWYVFSSNAGTYYKLDLDDCTSQGTTAMTINGNAEIITPDGAGNAYVPSGGSIVKKVLNTGATDCSYSLGGSVKNAVYADDDNIFVTSNNGKVVKINDSCDLQWSFTMNVTSDASYTIPAYDYEHDQLYNGECNSGRTAGQLYAIDGSTGAVNWYVTESGFCVVSSPAYHGGRVLVAWLGYYVPPNIGKYAAYNWSTGAKLWENSTQTGSGWATPVVIGNDYVYHTQKGTSPYAMILRDITTGYVVDSSQTCNGNPKCGSPAASGGVLVVPCGAGDTLKGINVGTGTISDFYPYHGINGTGYDATTTAYGSTIWSAVASNSTVITNGSLNSISHTFGGYGNYQWNIKVTNASGSTALAPANYSLILSAVAGEDVKYCNSCDSCTGYIANSTLGETIYLENDISDSDTCIDFSGNDGVNFNCQGYTITSTTGIGDAIKVYGLNDSIIQGCTNISYFQNAIHSVTTNVSGNLTIYNISIYDTSGTGIVLVGYEHNLTDVLVEGASGAGLTLGYGANSLTRVNASYTGSYGLHLSSSDNNTIEDCDFISNSDDGIYLQVGDWNTVNNTYISGSIGSGDYNLEVSGVYNNFTNNILWGSNAIRVSGSYFGNLFYNNNVTGTNSISATSTNRWNTTQSAATNIIGRSGYGGNYWPAYGGVDANGDGIGDTAYTLATGNIDYLPLMNPNYTLSSVVINETGDTEYAFSAIPGAEETINISIDYDGNSPDEIYMTLYDDIANATLVSANTTANVSLQPSSITTISLNLTIGAAAESGSYSGNITFTSVNDSTQIQNITINFTVSATAADMDITNSSWSVAFTAGGSASRYFEINNTGDYNGSHCNMSYSGLGSVSFDTSDFMVEPGVPQQVKATWTGSSAGSSSTSRVIVTCTATAGGGTDFDQVVGSVSISAVDGGGGGGGGYVPPPDTCGSFTVFPDTTLSGSNLEGEKIAWWVSIYNGNTSQKYLFDFSGDAESYCEVVEPPTEETPVNGLLQIRVECIAPEDEKTGHMLITTDTGCEYSLAIIISSGDVISAAADAIFKAATGIGIADAEPIHWLWIGIVAFIAIAGIAWILKS